jgi:ABC-type proline/glycine betaine transport system permease subunit
MATISEFTKQKHILFGDNKNNVEMRAKHFDDRLSMTPVMTFIFVIVCGFFLVEANLCMFLIVCLYMCCHWRSSYQEGMV